MSNADPQRRLSRSRSDRVETNGGIRRPNQAPSDQIAGIGDTPEPEHRTEHAPTSDAPDIAGIVAVARNGVIGADGDMPWRLKGDLPRLKRLTMGDVLVMGRRTWDSLPGALPGRTSMVLTRSSDWSAPGAHVVHSLDDALARAAELAPGRTVWIFGGGEIYRMAWDLIGRWEVTEVHAEPSGDTTFPGLPADEWVETYRDRQDGFDWVGYRRR